MARARAKATRWRWPPESWLGRRFAKSRELDGFEKLLDAGADLRFGRALASFSHAETEGDIFEDVEMLEEGVVLEDESRPALIRALPGDVAIAEEDLAVIRKLESRDDTQQCCFAGSARAEQSHQLATLDSKVNVPQRREFAERFGDVSNMDAHDVIFPFRRRPGAGVRPAIQHRF